MEPVSNGTQISNFFYTTREFFSFNKMKLRSVNPPMRKGTLIINYIRKAIKRNRGSVFSGPIVKGFGRKTPARYPVRCRALFSMAYCSESKGFRPLIAMINQSIQMNNKEPASMFLRPHAGCDVNADRPKGTASIQCLAFNLIYPETFHFLFLNC